LTPKRPLSSGTGNDGEGVGRDSGTGNDGEGVGHDCATAVGCEEVVGGVVVSLAVGPRCGTTASVLPMVPPPPPCLRRTMLTGGRSGSCRSAAARARGSLPEVVPRGEAEPETSGSAKADEARASQQIQRLFRPISPPARQEPSCLAADSSCRGSPRAANASGTGTRPGEWHSVCNQARCKPPMALATAPAAA